ncbi:ATP-binding protein [Wansuia hejianensis]|uniref:histidine kinase n=1 Tax=Wansuia hejianensis TaxID=2763667 RepID=A0A926F3N7_9FIRM|nr:sensor histidine kinase [Wansuia hejianensis]
MTETKKIRLKKYIVSVIIIALFGELYFFPFKGSFRFSAGVLAFSLILLYLDLSEIYLTLFTSLTVLLLRGFINSLSIDGSIVDILKLDLPGALYYMLFGVLAHLSALTEKKDKSIQCISILFFIDIISNLFESLLRGNLNINLFHYIILIGTARSIISYTLFILLRRQEILIRQGEHQKRYAQLNSIISNIQAEMFYLNKSMKDIENVMSKSYKLYEENKENLGIREDALDIAREVHEIKKDYYRVIKGFESFLEDFDENDFMDLKDISLIIENNINRYIEQSNKKIDFRFVINNNIPINEYYLLFTILNNLIINGIDASGEKGEILVIQKTGRENMIFLVEDKAKGIDEDIIPYIFNPGFTTKYDENTGEASTGIGLSHVKNIVDKLKGTITINSKKGQGTQFKISIPINSLRR